jgi:hypothetical protein
VAAELDYEIRKRRMYKIVVTDDRFGGDFSVERGIFKTVGVDLKIHNLKDEAEGRYIP